jgi:ribosome biogenesis GTPase
MQSGLDICYEQDQFFRITEIHKNRILGIGELGSRDLLCPDQFLPIRQNLAVGDWVLAKPKQEHMKIEFIIPAKNRLQRLSGEQTQVIAANLDYLWILTSANKDFNPKRLQRYLALAYEYDIEPVIILTKTDLNDDKVNQDYLDQVRDLSSPLCHGVSILHQSSLAELDCYLSAGNTIALLGSSGVGKSSLLNALSPSSQQLTKDIRIDDDKGKHTTTSRQLFYTEQGAAIIDTPGMRELQLNHAVKGIDSAFAEIVELAQQCKYSDCQHQSEPGCAVQAAIDAGAVDESQFNNYVKLLKEDDYAKRRGLGAYAEKQHDKNFTKMIKRIKTDSW